jgi:hypothetical protein
MQQTELLRFRQMTHKPCKCRPIFLLVLAISRDWRDNHERAWARAKSEAIRLIATLQQGMHAQRRRHVRCWPRAAYLPDFDSKAISRCPRGPALGRDVQPAGCNASGGQCGKTHACCAVVVGATFDLDDFDALRRLFVIGACRFARPHRGNFDCAQLRLVRGLRARVLEHLLPLRRVE